MFMYVWMYAHTLIVCLLTIRYSPGSSHKEGNSCNECVQVVCLHEPKTGDDSVMKHHFFISLGKHMVSVERQKFEPDHTAN